MIHAPEHFGRNDRVTVNKGEADHAPSPLPQELISAAQVKSS